MANIWIRQRLPFTLLMCLALALLVVPLCVYPYIDQRAGIYNSQSLYRNTSIDFIAPEPSFEQVATLPGTNGIEAVFPFYVTKTPVAVDGKSRTTTVLIADQSEALDGTMYTTARRIRQAGEAYDNPILVDWQFCRETGADIGDALTLRIGAMDWECQISAIYETNDLYEGGALLLQATRAQMDEIRQGSSNNGYSAMYISASDVDACRAYLTTQYRPLGRLRAREQFSDDAQYQIHYDAIMSGNYANEITDLRVRENALELRASSISIWLGALLTLALVIAQNALLANRGCEGAYFTGICIPKGMDVRPYYIRSAICETVGCWIAYAAALALKLATSKAHIPGAALDLHLAVIPASVALAETVCLLFVNRRVYAPERNVVAAEERGPVAPGAVSGASLRGGGADAGHGSGKGEGGKTL